MTSIREFIRKQFAPAQPIPVGIYHYQSPPDADFPLKAHLRVEPGGRGVLIVNASTVLHLNQTAAEYAWHMIQQTPEDKVAAQIAKRYRVSKAQAAQDYADFRQRIRTLLQTPNLDPVTYLGFEREDPYSGEIAAPYRLDCAITYRLPAGAAPEVAPQERVTRELSTDEWKSILSRAWEVGIPHIVFTGGEPTLRADLIALIAHAEELGQVTGLLSDGLHLHDSNYRQTILQTGLDHLMLVLQPENPASWKALEAVLSEDLFTAVHLTITADNAENIITFVDRLASLGVTSLSLSSYGPALDSVMEAARQRAAEHLMDLVWDLPVPYSDRNPVTLELEETAKEEDTAPPSEGAGRAWLYVEPDGDILREQGRTTVLGNALDDDWREIWKKARGR